MTRTALPPWQGAASPRSLSEGDFSRAAQRLGCDVPAIRAVWEVEAGGQHFLGDGSLIRRFEPHHFPRQHWPALGFAPRSGEAPWRASVRLSSETMFRRAAAIDLRAALRASSWGAPQIMGFNAEAAGFASEHEMVAHMAASAAHQLGAFVQLVEGWGLAPALRAHDWRRFAARYNGSGQVDEYARRMEAAYRRHSGGQRSAEVLRLGSRGPGVAALQRALGIADDGAFGPETHAAVIRFQAGSGLATDGVVGHQTWNAIRAAEPSVAPPAQESVGDARADLTAQITAGTAAVTGIAGASGALRESLPPELYQTMIWGAAGFALIYAAALLWRRLTARVRA
jgi:hypothetical protein